MRKAATRLWATVSLLWVATGRFPHRSEGRLRLFLGLGRRLHPGKQLGFRGRLAKGIFIGPLGVMFGVPGGFLALKRRARFSVIHRDALASGTRLSAHAPMERIHKACTGPGACPPRLSTG